MNYTDLSPSETAAFRANKDRQPRLCELETQAFGRPLDSAADKDVLDDIGRSTFGQDEDGNTVLQCGDGTVCERMCATVEDDNGVVMPVSAAGGCLLNALGIDRY